MLASICSLNFGAASLLISPTAGSALDGSATVKASPPTLPYTSELPSFGSGNLILLYLLPQADSIATKNKEKEMNLSTDLLILFKF